jgi:hypothetical protein
MFGTKSCAEIELRMGLGVVCLGSSAMASLAWSAYSLLEHFNGFL